MLIVEFHARREFIFFNLINTSNINLSFQSCLEIALKSAHNDSQVEYTADLPLHEGARLNGNNGMERSNRTISDDSK